ncbi:frizzled-4-like [Leptopilina heterotoma]|uniref:frizzled-4-like n=1 Tax=Leptopilina heterotoma TaxID=63436 RepID=UPI001CA94076|nr:frizzled-4-like [Leptopilina heterotoma]
MNLIWTTLVLMAITSLVNAWSIYHTGHPGTDTKCERLSVSFCRGLGYNLTSMPNFMGHENQLQAERGLQQFMPLVHNNCSKHLMIFFCAVFAPVCSENLAIPPCKPLCLSVRRACEPVLSRFNLPWLNILDCDRFPEAKFSGNTLCVQPPQEEATLSETLSPAVSPAIQQQWPVQSLQPTQLPAASNHHNQCPKHFIQAPDIHNITCIPKCGADAYYRTEDKRFTERWMIGWAWLCFLSTLFTLLTFWVDPSRFRYPERPIVFLALCYNLLSVAFIIRGAVGSENLSCASQLDGPSYVPVHDGLRSMPCTIWWFARYYFGLVSSVWWSILCGCWFLSAKHEWSSEALHNISTYLHAIAWGLPILLTAGSLIAKSVVADELTGLCQISDESALWLEVLPHAILLLLGCGFACLAGGALVRVRRAVRSAGRSATKLERLMTRLGIFALLYALPALGSLACTIYESRIKPLWREFAFLAAYNCINAQNCDHGPIYSAAGLEVALLRLFLSLVIGVTAGMWVWSGKTCRAWSRLLAAPSKLSRPTVNLEANHQYVDYSMFHGLKSVDSVAVA